MLIATINHNLPEWTDNLVSNIRYELSQSQLLQEINTELFVLDNGSEKRKISSNTTHAINHNCYYGGAFNIIVDYFLNNTTHEWLYVLNNDLVFNYTSKFIERSLKEAIGNDLSIYSPSIVNASISQCNWKQMYNWGSGGVRYVQWIDFQAPLIHRSVLEKIVSYDDRLIYGWGIDFYTCIIANRNNCNIGVSDCNTITHMDSLTIKSGALANTAESSNFYRNAEKGLADFFNGSEFAQEYLSLRSYGTSYKN